MTKQAALYIRVSTDAQFEEGYSVEAQKDMLEGYCRSRGWKSFQFYIDGGYTGSNIERPQMQRLIEDVRAGRISQVVVYKLDRLSRSQKDTLFLIEDVFNPAGVGFTSMNENLDTGTPMGRAMLGIMSAFAQLERETIRERTRMGMRERVRSGFWMGGGHPPFGYDYDSASGCLRPNADAASVRLIYRLYLQGLSAARIADMTGFHDDKPIRDILTRKSYTGIIEYNGIEYEGKHEAIIERPLFDRVQEAMRTRSTTRSFESRHLLTGLVYCGRCGARMRYQKWGEGGYKLTCYSQQSSKKYLIRDASCDNPKIWAEDVERAVIEDFENRALDTDSDMDGEPPVLKSGLDSKIQETERRIRRLYTLYAAAEDDLLLESIEEQKRLLQTLMAEQKAEEQSLEDAQSLTARRDRFRRLAEAWEEMTLSERQSVMRELIERVEIDADAVTVHYRL